VVINDHLTAALHILCLQLAPPSPSTFDEIKSTIDTNTSPPGKNSHQNGKNRSVWQYTHLFCHFDGYFFQVDLSIRMRLLYFTLHYGEHRIVLPGEAIVETAMLFERATRWWWWWWYDSI